LENFATEPFDEMINGYAAVLRFYADDLKKIRNYVKPQSMPVF